MNCYLDTSVVVALVLRDSHTATWANSRRSPVAKCNAARIL
jgi:hypothetical protein